MRYWIISIIAIISFVYFIIKYNKKKVEYSFKDSADICNLPIVPFTEGDIQLNFLIDTGSNESYISETASKLLLGTPIEVSMKSLTGSGVMTSSKMLDVVLNYLGKDFKHSLYVNKSLDNSFKLLEDNTGITVHGILGSDFLSKYNYVIDFKGTRIYIK